MNEHIKSVELFKVMNDESPLEVDIQFKSGTMRTMVPNAMELIGQDKDLSLRNTIVDAFKDSFGFTVKRPLIKEDPITHVFKITKVPVTEEVGSTIDHIGYVTGSYLYLNNWHLTTEVITRKFSFGTEVVTRHYSKKKTPSIINAFFGNNVDDEQIELGSAVSNPSKFLLDNLVAKVIKLNGGAVAGHFPYVHRPLFKFDYEPRIIGPKISKSVIEFDTMDINESNHPKEIVLEAITEAAALVSNKKHAPIDRREGVMVSSTHNGEEYLTVISYNILNVCSIVITNLTTNRREEYNYIAAAFLHKFNAIVNDESKDAVDALGEFAMQYVDKDGGAECLM